MAKSSYSTSVWAKEAMDMATDYASHRVNMSDRDCFDDYQDRRHIEGDLTTRFAWNDADCTRMPALGTDDMGAGTSWITPPQCLALRPDLVGWERKEQLGSAGRRADNAKGATADKLVADPTLGWSDVMPSLGGAMMGGASAMRLGSGVAYAPTSAAAVWVVEKSVVENNLGGSSVATPSVGAISGAPFVLSRDYAALFERSKVGGGAAAYNLRPGMDLR